MVLEARVVAVLIRKLGKITLRRGHEREAADGDVPEHSSVMSRLSGAGEYRESLAINVGHNAAPRVVNQDNGGAILGLFGRLSDHGIDWRLRRGVRHLQRHCGENHVKAAESGLVL